MSVISIIIPHHNTPTLLQRCLDSIPADKGIQVIVVDDNSDPTKVDFEKFPGKVRPDVEIFLTKEGRGAGYARNVGLQHAKGDWLLFADSDDYFVQGFYDVIRKYIDNDTDMYNVLTAANVGKCYRFTGTTGTYTNGDLYVVEESE